MSFWSRITNVFRADRLNREIEEELASHLDEAIEDGRDPDEARRALGRALHHREQSHNIRVLGWLDSLRADLVFGWRQIKRNKITSAAAALSLALAIGACTSAFRLIDALFLRPLPVAHPEHLYLLYRQGMGFDNRPGSWDSFAYPDFQLMRAAAQGRAELIAASYADRADLTYKTDQEIEKATLQYVSGRMFDSRRRTRNPARIAHRSSGDVADRIILPSANHREYRSTGVILFQLAPFPGLPRERKPVLDTSRVEQSLRRRPGRVE